MQSYILFQYMEGSMLMQHVPHFKMLNFLVPEERISEICSPQDYAEWSRIGFECHGDTSEESDALDRAVEAMRNAPWVIKSTGQACAAPDGSVIVRVLTHFSSTM
jgi:hypothetical protein